MNILIVEAHNRAPGSPFSMLTIPVGNLYNEYLLFAVRYGVQATQSNMMSSEIATKLPHVPM